MSAWPLPWKIGQTSTGRYVPIEAADGLTILRISTSRPGAEILAAAIVRLAELLSGD